MSQFSRTFQLFGLLLVQLACITSCELETGLPPSSVSDITAFELRVADNPGLSEDVLGTISDRSIVLVVPADTDVTSLVPTIQYNGESISPASSARQDFTAPVEYTVTAADFSESVYKVSVYVAAASSKDIRSFRIDSARATIEGTDISLTLAYGTDLTRLAPVVGHTGVKISPASNTEQDFSAPVRYVVTAQDGTTKTYSVTINIAPSSAKEITDFKIGSASASINGTQITLTLPHGSDLRELEPTIAHTGGSVEPDSGSAQDFRGPVTYLVTAADGSSQAYTVTVNLAPSTSKDITVFRIGGVAAKISGSAIAVTVPYGTDATYLAPVVQHTGVSVNPASAAPRDFTQPVTYTVTAADGSTKVYTVTVVVAPNTAKAIIDFVILGSTADIDGSTIALTVPYGANPAALVPTIIHSGAQIEPASGVMRDFTDPVEYVVTAADGSTRTYTAIITIAKSSANSITRFQLLNVEAMVTNGAITLTLPFGSNVSAAAPQITHTGASIEPAAGTQLDFGSPQTYTVTAANGETRVYNVNVTIAPDTAKTITRFALLGHEAEIDGASITLTLPPSTDVTALAPDITHTGASIEPNEDQLQDFTNPVKYTVTAANNSTAEYTVTVTVAQNDAKDITRFTILGVPGMIADDAISLTLPYGNDASALIPTVTHTGQRVSPASGAQADFTNPVPYTVTAEDGTMKTYTVTVTVTENDAKEITDFEILGVDGDIAGDAISVIVPYNTPLTSLAPTIVHTGQDITPMSGVPQDFTAPFDYVVTAEDGSMKTWQVTVTVAANSAKDIAMFSILDLQGTVGVDTVTLTVPYGTNLTALTPTVTITGASVHPPSDQAQDFTNPVTYTVTADDTSTKEYMVTVTSAAAAVDCRALLTAVPSTTSGVHTIDPDGAGAIAPFSVYCDMTNDGGGWTLIGKTAAGDYTALTDDQFRDLIVNPGSDVNPSYLQDSTAPSAGQIAFYSRAKTNALYHASGALRAVRVNMSGHLTVPGANTNFFQQRVNAPSNWDFWLALRNAKMWNRDESVTGPSDHFLNYFGTDFVLTNLASDFDITTNVVTQRGDDTTFGFFNIYTHTAADTSPVDVSRHMGLLNDGVGNLDYLWLLTADPTDGTAPGYLDTRYKNDATTQQKSLIWLR